MRHGKAWVLALLGAVALAGGPAAAEGGAALEGTWHVIAHFKDSATQNPCAPRWEDRVWVFHKEGDRLRWVDYPIVVLSDESGRFEGRRRVLAHWEPSPAQADELAAGPTVNSRGSKSKTLRGSDADGWKSTSRQPRSMAYVTYEETWTIEDPGGTPTFTRVDVLGSAGAEGADGRTLYATEEVREGGELLVGRFDRDGTRVGTFQMRRVGDVEFLSTDGPTPNEKAAERARQQLLDAGGLEE